MNIFDWICFVLIILENFVILSILKKLFAVTDMNIKIQTQQEKFTHFIESKQTIFKYGNYFDKFTAFILKSTDGGSGSSL